MSMIRKYVLTLFLLQTVVSETNGGPGLYMDYLTDAKGYEVALSFDDPYGKEYKPVIQNSPFTYMNQTRYHPTKASLKLGEKIVKVDDKLYQGFQYLDDLILQNTNVKVPGFHFFVFSTKKIKVPKEGYSFGYNIQNKNHSIVHLLKSESLIDSLKYTFYPQTTNKGRLYLGSLPGPLVKDRKAYSCLMNPSLKSWNCNLKKSFTPGKEKIEFLIGHHVEFQSSKMKSIFPCKFLDFLENGLLKELFDKGTCNNYYRGKKRFFSCEGSLPKEEKMSFDFYNFTVDFSVVDMFKCRKGRCTSMFKCYERQKKWIFGSDFMKQFVLTFDYESPGVTLYDGSAHERIRSVEYKEVVTDGLNKGTKGPKKTFFLNILLLIFFVELLGIGLIIVMKIFDKPLLASRIKNNYVYCI